MTIDVKLDRTRAALMALGDLACNIDGDSDTPSDNFGFGLHVLLYYVASELKEAKEELEQHMKDVRQNKGNTDGGTA
jgi:hypothetical protein